MYIAGMFLANIVSTAVQLLIELVFSAENTGKYHKYKEKGSHLNPKITYKKVMKKRNSSVNWNENWKSVCLKLFYFAEAKMDID